MFGTCQGCYIMLIVPCALELNPTYPPFIKPVMKTDLGMLQLREKDIIFFSNFSAQKGHIFIISDSGGASFYNPNKSWMGQQPRCAQTNGQRPVRLLTYSPE